MGGLATLPATGAFAQANYPDKPIRMIIAFAAGGPTDIVGRMMAPRLAEILGQQIVVENKPGATGNIGTAMVADAKPDGYTILFSASTMAMAPALYGKQVGYDPVNGFEGIAYVASVPLIVVVPADGAKSIGELADMLRKEKGKYSYPSSGNGGMIHLAGYLFTEKVGGEALHVPYRGSAPGMVDLIAGRHAFQMDTLGTSKGFIEGGKLRVLAVAADKRLPQLPDVPTVAGGAGLPVLDQHLVRRLRAQGHAAADRRQAQCRLQQGAEGARGEEVGRGPRHRAHPGIRRRPRPRSSMTTRWRSGIPSSSSPGRSRSSAPAASTRSAAHDQVLLPPLAQPGEGGAVPGGGGPALRARPVDTRKGEQHSRRSSRSTRTPRCRRSSTASHRVRQQRDLLYLAEKTGKFLPGRTPKTRGAMLSWLMFVATGIGPYSGQAVHFKHFAPEPTPTRSTATARGRASLGHSRRASGRPSLHGGRHLYDRRHGRLGLGALIPFILGEEGWGLSCPT